MATAAPAEIMMMFTTSLFSTRAYSVAPRRLSKFVATNAAHTHTAAPVGSTCPRRQANAEYTALAANPAKVPSKLTAPSVPLGTGFRLVIKIVVLPYAFPISLATVSESLVAKLATKPVLRVVHSAPSPWNARAARAQAASANPDPHTLADVLLPSFL